MSWGKWITGAIGWAVGGPIGALVGYLLGTAMEGDSLSGNKATGRASVYSAGEQRNSFLVSMLVLSAAVMKADGKVMRSELDYVKRFITGSFGEAALPESLRLLKELLQKEINLLEVCAQIKLYMNSSQRLQLLHFLVGIAEADGYVSKNEVETIRNIGRYLGIQDGDVNSILAMFNNNLESAYAVLEIDERATDEEVKRAYKRLALKHHPDKVESLGPDVKRAAEEKFKQIVAAYEAIKKERNM